MPSTSDDEGELARHAAALADAIEQELAPWVERSVAAIYEAYTGDPPPPTLAAAAAAAGVRAHDDLVGVVRRLLARDIDDQPTNPLSVLRSAVAYPTEVLRTAGVPPIARDGFDERNFPDDDFGLTPASFADIAPSLHEPGLVWGAAKAHVHLRRRRPNPDSS